MLVLSRSKHQAVRIGKDVVVTVVGIRGKQVRLGVEAPANVSIDRDEVRRRKQEWDIPSSSLPTDGSFTSAST